MSKRSQPDKQGRSNSGKCSGLDRDDMWAAAKTGNRNLLKNNLKVELINSSLFKF